MTTALVFFNGQIALNNHSIGAGVFTKGEQAARTGWGVFLPL